MSDPFLFPVELRDPLDPDWEPSTIDWVVAMWQAHYAGRWYCVFNHPLFPEFHHFEINSPREKE